MDVYLFRFKRTSLALHVPKDTWALNLARCFDGRALEVYQRLDQESAQDYEVLKSELLMRYTLSEGGYRRTFKPTKRYDDETATQFVERLRRYSR